jgi:hypothetical protein
MVFAYTGGELMGFQHTCCRWYPDRPMGFWTVPIDQSAAFPGSNSSIIKRVDRPALLKRTRPDQVRSDHAANFCCAKCYFGSPGDLAEHTGGRRNQKCRVEPDLLLLDVVRSTEKPLARRASIDRRPAGEFEISGAAAPVAQGGFAQVPVVHSVR